MCEKNSFWELAADLGSISESNNLYIPLDDISNDEAFLHLTITDIDTNSRDLLFSLSDRVGLDRKTVKLTRPKTDEFVELAIEAVPLQMEYTELKDYQLLSLKVKAIYSEIRNTTLYISNEKSNASARETGARIYHRFFDLRERILDVKGGEDYKSLVDLYNESVLKFSGKTITATDWINEDHPALPDAAGLLILDNSL